MPIDINRQAGAARRQITRPARCGLAALSVAALVISGLTATAASAETTWLCRPGLAGDPCLSSEEATVELDNGSSVIQHAQPAANPPVDCFYVYPTVSSQIRLENGHVSPNANLEIDPEETQIAIDQASRFSQTCRVYAPMYPQLTLYAITTPGAVTPEASPRPTSVCFRRGRNTSLSTTTAAASC